MAHQSQKKISHQLKIKEKKKEKYLSSHCREYYNHTNSM